MKDRVREIVEYAFNNGIYGVFKNTSIYIEIKKSRIKPYNDPVILLLNIHIPESMRKKGLFTAILDELMKKAHGQYLQIGPFVTDESEFIIKILKRKNFTQVSPFSMRIKC